LPPSELVGNLPDLLLKVGSQGIQFHVERSLVEGVMNRLGLGLLLDLELELIDLLFEIF